ncbi:hypothetical protein [uncultured Polaribacter sp.]|uniref:hypothetical protein n=1 Tax=uncultured Polaribacter sp. TaxID=174711 RepID=UPI00262EBCA7|nr:hypothetical protein [uncultured Polaribacter sp.]
MGFKNGTYWLKVILEEKIATPHIVFDVPESNIHTFTIYQNSKEIASKNLADTHFSLLVPNNPNNAIYFLQVSFKMKFIFR